MKESNATRRSTTGHDTTQDNTTHDTTQRNVTQNTQRNALQGDTTLRKRDRIWHVMMRRDI